MDTIHLEKELEYLIREAGKETATLLAEAMQEGIHLLFRRSVSDAYMSKKIDRKKAIHLVGSSAIQELEEAWCAVESDVKWGLRGE